MRRVGRRTVAGGLVLWLAVTGCGSPAPDLTPVSWPAGDAERYAGLTDDVWGDRGGVEGSGGMVVVTRPALGARVGVEALRRGGSAMDAALATALTQVALAAESWVSYAGFLTLVYYDAATGEAHALNAGFNTVLEEDDPLTIPFLGTPSGRAAVVPGFMAGVRAAHDRFGRLPWASIFGPAIHVAEEGFVLGRGLAAAMQSRADVVTRTEDGRSIFTKADGALYETGDRFRQPALAETLRRVAAEGAGYMYTGEWAEKLVAAVQAEGGKLTSADLAAYEPLWSAPAHTSYRGYDVYASAPPNYGGVATLEFLNVLEAAGLPRAAEHYTESGADLYWVAQALRLNELVGPRSPGSQTLPSRYLGERDLSMASRLEKSTAEWLWGRMHEPGWSALKTAAFEESKAVLAQWEEYTRNRPGHSDAVVVIDAEGNIAALVHTINTMLWGMGVFVDGITVPDIGALQQQLLHQVGPGARLPDPTTPLVVTRNGKAVLGSASIGFGVHVATAQSVINVLDYEMDPQAAVSHPQLLRTYWRTIPEHDYQPVGEGDFRDDVIEGVRALGQPVQVLPAAGVSDFQGHWIAVRVDRDKGVLQGGVPPFSRGYVAAVRAKP